MNGARGGTRTPTPIKEPDPKSGASTNFATRAQFYFNFNKLILP